MAKIVRFTYERMGGRNQFSGTKQILHVLDMGRIQRYPLMRPNRRVDRIQLPSKMAMASSTEAPSQMMAWQAAVIRTASSVVF